MRSARKPTSPAARILTGWLYAFAALLLVAAGVAWVINSTYFPIRHVTISKSDNAAFERIDRAELIAAKNDSIVGNIFKVNLNRIKSRFESIPWAQEAEVTRIWPDTIAVRIVERVPVAYWNDDYLLDKNGELFIAPATDTLPRFYGPQASETTMVETYAQIAPLLARENLRLVRLDYSDRFAWQLELSNGITVKLGRNDTVKRVARFVEHWQNTLQPQADALLYVDMRYANGFAIQLRTGTPTLPAN